jgi:carbon storage regulator
MLIFSRRAGEKLLIGSNITLTVLEVKGQRVKVAIDAPDSMDIVRRELTGWLDLSSAPELPIGRTWLAEENVEPDLVLSR